MQLDELVAQFLYLNRRICVALRPQKIHTFTEDQNTAICSSDNSPCCRNQITEEQQWAKLRLIVDTAREIWGD